MTRITLFVICFWSSYSFAQDFTLLQPGFLRATFDGMAWGDLDGDGDLDVISIGNLDGNPPHRTALYINQDGIFLETPSSGLPDISNGTVALGDVNNDGLLDLALGGFVNGNLDNKIYLNNGDHTYSELVVPDLSPFHSFSNITWIDVDNDNDLDLFICGGDPITLIARTWMFINDDLEFTKVTDFGVPDAYAEALDWADVDQDGDFDLLFIGADESNNFVADIFANNGDGTFVAMGADIPKLINGVSHFADYDIDGDFDLLLTGVLYDGTGTGGGYFTKIIENILGELLEKDSLNLLGLWNGGSNWIDFDLDSDQDIFALGEKGVSEGREAKLYENEGDSNFIERSNLGITSDQGFGIARRSYIGDYDNDGDPDILLSNGTILRNNLGNNSYILNSTPSSPNNLNHRLNSNGAILNWDPGTDLETTEQGLQYNVRLGTTPGGSEITSPMSDIQSGSLKLPYSGNATSNKYSFRGPEGNYYWSVQTVDGAFKGSLFAEELQFALLYAPSEFTYQIMFDPLSVTLSWIDNSNMEEGYLLQKSVEQGSFSEIATLSANTTSFSDNEIQTERNYEISLSMIYQGQQVTGDSIDLLIPEAPSQLDFGFDGTTNIVLGWVDNSNFEQNYVVERTTDGNEVFEEIGRVSADQISFVDDMNGVIGGVTYRVHAITELGIRSDYSNPITVVITDLLDDQESKILTYPIPAGSYLNVVSPRVPLEINVRDDLGRTVKVISTRRSDLSTTVLNLNELSSGFYILELQFREKMIRKPILIQR